MFHKPIYQGGFWEKYVLSCFTANHLKGIFSAVPATGFHSKFLWLELTVNPVRAEICSPTYPSTLPRIGAQSRLTQWMEVVIWPLVGYLPKKDILASHEEWNRRLLLPFPPPRDYDLDAGTIFNDRANYSSSNQGWETSSCMTRARGFPCSNRADWEHPWP